MTDEVRYVYLEDDGSGGVTIWPLEESDVTWKGRPVLTRASSHPIDADYCEGYDVGRPGYYRATLEGDPPEICEVDEGPLPCQEAKPKGHNVRGKPLVFDGWEQHLVNMAQSQAFVLIAEGTPHERLCWGGHGVDAWREQAEQKRRDKAEAKVYGQELNAQRRRDAWLHELHDGGDAFINPYTFVPLPDKVRRSSPAGHARAKEGHLSGFIDVEYEFKTPLMLANDWHPAGGGEHRAGQLISIPGSSFRGTTRSLFEVLTNSCLHIIDPDYVPVHRSEVQMRPDARLAVVQNLDETTHKLTVLLTTRVVWATAKALQERLKEPLKSGLRLDFPGGFRQEYGKEQSFGKDKRGRKQTRQALTPSGVEALELSDGGRWVLHVADAGAKGAKPFDSVHVALGELKDEPMTLDLSIWEEFRELCRHSVDVEGGNLADTAPDLNSPDWPRAEVCHVHKGNRTVVGWRRKSDGMLGPGDSVWLVYEKGEVVGLKMSLNWREMGQHPLKKRLPDESLLPCHDPDDLCPACSTFGFIEQRTEHRDAAEQNAYASHVRFTPLRSHGDVALRQEVPPPMRSPRASAGAFYLSHKITAGDTDVEASQWREAGNPEWGQPATRWGSKLDSPSPRRIAGRKFYWHGQEPDDVTPTPRHKRRGRSSSKEELDESRWFAPAETHLSGRVFFENLSPAQLGFLLIALNPQLLADELGIADFGGLATHLGGGKGLGYGTAVATRCQAHVEGAADRYRDGTAAFDDAERKALDEAARELRESPDLAQAIAKALGLGSVPADRLWYPTMGNFKERSRTNQKEFDLSFKYYAKFSGANTGVPMRTLPRIDEWNQYMTNKEKP